MQGEESSGGLSSLPFQGGWHETDRKGNPVLILRPAQGCDWGSDSSSGATSSTAALHSSGRHESWQLAMGLLAQALERLPRGTDGQGPQRVVVVVDLEGIEAKALRRKVHGRPDGGVPSCLECLIELCTTLQRHYPGAAFSSNAPLAPKLFPWWSLIPPRSQVFWSGAFS